MTAGVPDAMDLVEIRRRSRPQAFRERLKAPSVSAILGLKLAELSLRTTQDEFGERRRVGPEPLAQRS